MKVSEIQFSQRIVDIEYTSHNGDRIISPSSKDTTEMLPQFDVQESRLAFYLDENDLRSLAEAKRDMRKLIDDHEITVMQFKDFGAATISKSFNKKNGNFRISSDSFMQLSLHLAYYIDQGKMASGYETASTRLFHHGRTETIRTQSCYVKKYCEMFAEYRNLMQLPASNLNKIVEIRKHIREQIGLAAKYHRNYISKCMAGMACDRYFRLGMLLFCLLLSFRLIK